MRGMGGEALAGIEGEARRKRRGDAAGSGRNEERSSTIPFPSSPCPCGVSFPLPGRGGPPYLSSHEPFASPDRRLS